MKKWYNVQASCEPENAKRSLVRSVEAMIKNAVDEKGSVCRGM
ncbi:hypothetical protein [Hespellia stercorisuis]|nr:hypothetical protein [Hespellia stercorisuis]